MVSTLKQLSYAFLLLIVGLYGCNEKPAEGDEQSVASSDSLIVINDIGFRMQFSVPRSNIGENDLVVYFNEATGIYEVRIGEKIQFDILEDSITIEEFKEELNNHPMFTYKINEEDENWLMYQSVLPSGQDYSFNLAHRSMIGDHHYFITSSQGAEFTMTNIKTLRSILETLEPVSE